MKADKEWDYMQQRVTDEESNMGQLHVDNSQ